METVIKRLIKVLKDRNINKVTILGHDNIDEDSCISALLLRYILECYGIEGQIKIMDVAISPHTLEAIKKLGHNMSEYQSEGTQEEEYLLLVDHYATVHKGRVIGCIDHHPTNQEFEYPIYENDMASATCKKIYDYMVEDEMLITPAIIKQVVYGVMIDTFAFKSSRGTKQDKAWIEDMIAAYHLDYKAMYNDALRLTDLNQSSQELALTNLKSYEFNGNRVKSSYIQVDGKPKQIDKILTYLMEQTQKEELVLWVFLLVDISEIKTIEYRISKEKIECIKHDKLTSRAQGIMPQIEKLFI